MPNSRPYPVNLKDGLQLISMEEMANRSQEYDQYGNIKPELNILAAKNVMPTDTGYTSFFGTTDVLLNAETVLGNVQDILSYKTSFGETVLLALCEDGIYLRALAGDDIAATVVETATEITITSVDGKCSWKRGAYSEFGSISKWKLWTYAILENKLYLYQKGMDYIAYFHATEPGIFVFEKLSPTYIISTVPQAYSYIVDMDQEWNNSTFKSLDIGVGKLPVVIKSSSDAAEIVPDMIKAVNSVNNGTTNLSLNSVIETIGDLAAVIDIDNLPDDFNITDIDGNQFIPSANNIGISWEDMTVPLMKVALFSSATATGVGYQLVSNGTGYYIAGRISQGGVYGAVLLSISLTGSILWSKVYSPYPTVTSTLFYGAAIDSSGNIYTSGLYNNVCCIAKHTSAGVLVWYKEYTSITNVGDGNSIHINANDIITIVGKAGVSYSRIFRIDVDGIVLWDNGVDDVLLSCVCIDSTDNIYVAGQNTIFSHKGCFIAKYSSTGVQQWMTTLAVAGADEFNPPRAKSIKVDSLGNIIVGGLYDSSRGMLLVKLNPTTGAIIWQSTWVAGSSSWAEIITIAIDPTNDDIYVSGQYEHATLGRVFPLFKINTAGIIQFARGLNNTDLLSDFNVCNDMYLVNDRLYMTGAYVGSSNLVLAILNKDGSILGSYPLDDYVDIGADYTLDTKVYLNETITNIAITDAIVSADVAAAEQSHTFTSTIRIVE